MAVTHQDIADQLSSLRREWSEAYQLETARIAKRRKELRQACGAIGHIFGSPLLRDDGGPRASSLSCLVCGLPQPLPQGQADPFPQAGTR